MWEFKLTRRKVILFLGPVIFCLATPMILWPLAAWEAASPRGNGAFEWAGIMVGAFGFLLIFSAFIIGSICLAFPQSRSIGLTCIASSAALFFGMLAGGSLGQIVRMHALAQLADRSKPLIMAIKNYEQKFGHPPDSLDALVPEFISEIPATGIGSTPEYHYMRQTNDISFGKNPWSLEVFHAANPLAWDTFIYLPRQNYSELSHQYEGQIRKIGDWAYWYQG
jgi:hypothetical protein